MHRKSAYITSKIWSLVNVDKYFSRKGLKLARSGAVLKIEHTDSDLVNKNGYAQQKVELAKVRRNRQLPLYTLRSGYFIP